MKKITTTLMLVMSCSLFAAGTESGTHSATTKVLPWGGSWWPMETGELVLGWESKTGRKSWTPKEVKEFDSCLSSYTKKCVDLMKTMGKDQGKALSPMMKFDLMIRNLNERMYGKGEADEFSYTHAAKKELDIHYIGDNKNHPNYATRGFAGKCIGWALSTMDYPEPTKTKVIEGVAFEPADMKGILAGVYNAAQFFVPKSKVVGQEYKDQKGMNTKKNYEDVLPHQLIKALLKTVDKGTILEADMDPAEGVWNYPIFKYDLKWTKKSATKIEGTIELFFADDEVALDGVFSTTKNGKKVSEKNREDFKSRTLTFEMNVPADWSGDLKKIKTGKWTGASLDEHPDALILGLEDSWRDLVLEYEGSEMDSEVNFPLFYEVEDDDLGNLSSSDFLILKYFEEIL